MKLKALNINFKNIDQFVEQIQSALAGKKAARDKKTELIFDSIESFKRFMSPNKLEVLMTISRFGPDSIYQLAKIVNRQYPHVLKDIRQLENFKFIRLVSSGSEKNQLRPELVFNYDFIKVNAKIAELYPISDRSNRALLEADVG